MTDSFGAQLRRHRHAMGLTQEALAEKAQLSGQAIGALERGDRRFPHQATVDRLVTALGLSDRQRLALASAASRRGVPGRPASEPETVAPPRQLPCGIATFTGREQEADRLIRLFDEPCQAVVAAIAGMAGVGKTSLAVHIGHRLAGRFPDGQLYLDLGGQAPRPPDPLDALDALIRTLGDAQRATPATLDATSAHFRSLLAGKRVLLVLDNARDAEHVAPLLPGMAGSAAIVTSRTALPTLPQAHHLVLDVLSEQAAVRLLAATIGPERVAAEPDAAASMVRLCGLLPLAVHLAAARLAIRPNWPIAYLVSRLADEGQRLDELDTTSTGVRASFAPSIDQLACSSHRLDRQAARAYPLLALPDVPDFSTAVASRLLDEPERDTEQVLDRLTDLHLLDSPAPGRYRLHDLLRLYAGERAAQLAAPVRAAAITRVLELYASVAWRSMTLVAARSHRLAWPAGRWEATTGLSTPAEAFDWLDAHHPHIVTMVEQAAVTPGVPGDVVAAIGLGLFEYYRARARWRDTIRVNETALGLVAAGHDRIAAATLRNDLGIAVAELTHSAGAPDFRRAHTYLRQSLAEWEDLDDHQHLAACLNNLCFVFGLGDDLDTAIAFGERSLALNRELGQRYVETMTLVNLGVLYGRNGDPDRELRYATEAVAVARSIGDTHGMAYGQLRIGVVHCEEGRHRQAIANLRRSAKLWHYAGVRRDEAISLAALGRAHLGAGDHEAAARVLTDALALMRQYGGVEREAAVLADLDQTRTPGSH